LLLLIIAGKSEAKGESAVRQDGQDKPVLGPGEISSAVLRNFRASRMPAPADAIALAAITLIPRKRMIIFSLPSACPVEYLKINPKGIKLGACGRENKSSKSCRSCQKTLFLLRT